MRENELNIIETASNIPERDSAHIKGCLCSKSVRFGINGLHGALDTRRQRDVHTHTHAHSSTHTHQDTQAHTHQDTQACTHTSRHSSTHTNRNLQNPATPSDKIHNHSQQCTTERGVFLVALIVQFGLI